MTHDLLRVRGLRVSYRVNGRQRRVLDGFDLDIGPGGSHGLVGESGAGKSTVGYALTRYLPRGAEITADELTIGGHDVLALGARELRRFRRDTIGFVYQEPGQALNPTLRIGEQLEEAYRLRGASRAGARERTLDAVDRVALPDPERIVRRYPHELSGGQQQRVVIAMALAAEPRLLILDEPTTGLDSTVEAEIVALIRRLQAEQGFASLLISHNLPLVAATSSEVSVLRNGTLVERSTAAELLSAPAEEYTRELIAAVPRLDEPSERSRRGSVSSEAADLVTITGLRKDYGGALAVDGVDLSIRRGEILGLVGESGSGKSTLGKAIAGLIDAEGDIRHADTGHRRGVQMVFQNPDASLNPQHTVRHTLSRAIALLGGTETAASLLDRVGLDDSVLEKLPRQLSGGQKQRVAIARAFAGPVPLVVCDEPTSALDVSVQARIIALLLDLHEQTGVSLLFISHDLAVVRSLSDRIAVLHRGRLVDLAPTEELFTGGGGPYTRTLIAAAESLRTPSGGGAFSSRHAPHHTSPTGSGSRRLESATNHDR